MKYAIETLEIELNKLKQIQRDEDAYSVHPMYNPIQHREFRADIISIMKALDRLKKEEEG